MKGTTFFMLSCIFFVSTNTSKSKKSWEGLRPNTERESFAIQTAIKLYNITMNFDEKLKSAFKHDYYEEIVVKDGAELKMKMDNLENELLRFITAIELAGGVMPKVDNFTNGIDELSVKMDLDYNTMVKNTKVFTDKLLEALKSVRADKQRLMGETDKYTNLRKIYQDSKWLLEQENIFLRNPSKDAEPILVFDISILETLLGYYKELDAIEDKISPIMDKYETLVDMDESTEEFKDILKSQRRISDLNLLSIAPMVEKHDNMLRHYEAILTVEIERAQKLIPEMGESYDNMQKRIVKIAQEMGDQDVKIRGLSKKFNNFLIKANEEAVKRADFFPKAAEDRDEL